ncbi:helix-turn-helix domain-containing protein [bacterium]|nr:helix-turn-helix domain-containing protein [bacterium]
MIFAGRSSSRVQTRARILLLADQDHKGPGKRDDEIHEALGSAISTIARIRSRYVAEGLDGALYEVTSLRLVEKGMGVIYLSDNHYYPKHTERRHTHGKKVRFRRCAVNRSRRIFTV